MCASIKDRPMFVCFGGEGAVFTNFPLTSHPLVALKGIREMPVNREGLGCHSRDGKEATLGVTGAYQGLLNAYQFPWGRWCVWIRCLPVQSRSGQKCSTKKKNSPWTGDQNPGVQLSSSRGQGGEATHQCRIAISFTYQLKLSTKYLCNSRCEQFFKVNKKDLDKNSKGGSQLDIMIEMTDISILTTNQKIKASF